MASLYPRRLTSSQSMQLPRPQNSTQNDRSKPPARLARSSLQLPGSSTIRNLSSRAAQIRSTRTWTTTSGDLGLLADADEIEDRSIFIQEYNRLAKKHGIRILVVDDFDSWKPDEDSREKRRWYHRIFRPTNTRPASAPRLVTQPLAQHRRSASELAYLIHNRREAPKIIDLQSMIRLSGKSVLYLPADYAPCSLILPTCIRATAQFLTQNNATRGIFRVPGSLKVVNAIFDYYCHMDKGGANIAGTVRSASLPSHISYNAHDIGSVFKRLLSALPGGILGSLTLFDAFVAIYSQLHGEVEYPRTKQSKVRTRLIALAIGTTQSHYRRELICAVFGVLSLIGRVAEKAPREDEDGRPLPTTDLMGYAALGIIFGPLLVGELLENYPMNVAVPDSGMLILPSVSQKLQLDARRGQTPEPPPIGPPHVNKILAANNIAEMLISNWRDIVRQLKSLGTHYHRDASAGSLQNASIRPSASDSLILRLPPGLHRKEEREVEDSESRAHSPLPQYAVNDLTRKRSRNSQPQAALPLFRKGSITTLSPTLEESVVPESRTGRFRRRTQSLNPINPRSYDKPRTSAMNQVATEIEKQPGDEIETGGDDSVSNESSRGGNVEQVYLESVPPRISSQDQSQQADPFYTQESVSPRRQQALDERKRRLERLQRLKYTVLPAKHKTGRQQQSHRSNDSSTHLADEVYSKNADQPTMITPPKKSLTPDPYPVASSRSTQRRSLSQRGSVRALAALFEDNESPAIYEPSTPVTTLTPTKVWRSEVRRQMPRARVLRPSVSEGASLRLAALQGSPTKDKKPQRSFPSPKSNPPEGRIPDIQAPNPVYVPVPSPVPKFPRRYVNDSRKHVRGWPLKSDQTQKTTDDPVEAELGHSQSIITNLQQLLVDSVEEINGLKKQLQDQTQNRIEQDKLHEDLQQAKAECKAWQARAEKAERKVKVFEKFTARLRDLRDAAVAANTSGQDTIAKDSRVRFPEANHGSFKGRFSPKRPLTSTPRVRFADHHGQERGKVNGGGHATPAISNEGAGGQDGLSETKRGNGLANPEPETKSWDSMYNDVAELWLAARELLDGSEQARGSTTKL